MPLTYRWSVTFLDDVLIYSDREQYIIATPTYESHVFLSISNLFCIEYGYLDF